jgi:hypothetical protein
VLARTTITAKRLNDAARIIHGWHVSEARRAWKIQKATTFLNLLAITVLSRPSLHYPLFTTPNGLQVAERVEGREAGSGRKYKVRRKKDG